MARYLVLASNRVQAMETREPNGQHGPTAIYQQVPDDFVPGVPRPYVINPSLVVRAATQAEVDAALDEFSEIDEARYNQIKRARIDLYRARIKDAVSDLDAAGAPGSTAAQQRAGFRSAADLFRAIIARDRL